MYFNNESDGDAIIVRTNPPAKYFAKNRRMNDMDVLFDLLFKDCLNNSACFVPIQDTKINSPVNIFETKDDLIFEIAVVGIEEDKIDITTENNILKVSYIKEEECCSSEGIRVIMQKISKGSFDHKWKIPTIFNIKKIKATINNGLLNIKIPRALEAKPLKIEISNTKKNSK